VSRGGADNVEERLCWDGSGAGHGSTAGNYSVKASDVVRLSPLHHKHINVLGRYSFTLAESVVNGKLRPLNNPDEEGLFRHSAHLLLKLPILLPVLQTRSRC
jgi:hypothetical protein